MPRKKTENKLSIGEHWSEGDCWGFKFENLPDGQIRLWPATVNKATELQTRGTALDALLRFTQQYYAQEMEIVIAGQKRWWKETLEGVGRAQESGWMLNHERLCLIPTPPKQKEPEPSDLPSSGSP